MANPVCLKKAYARAMTKVADEFSPTVFIQVTGATRNRLWAIFRDTLTTPMREAVREHMYSQQLERSP